MLLTCASTAFFGELGPGSLTTGSVLELEPAGRAPLLQSVIKGLCFIAYATARLDVTLKVDEMFSASNRGFADQSVRPKTYDGRSVNPRSGASRYSSSTAGDVLPSTLERVADPVPTQVKVPSPRNKGVHANLFMPSTGLKNPILCKQLGEMEGAYVERERWLSCAPVTVGPGLEQLRQAR